MGELKVFYSINYGMPFSLSIISAEKAYVNIKDSFVNNSNATRRLQLVNTLINAEGKAVTHQKTIFKLKATEKLNSTQQFNDIKSPVLWSPESPYLYTMVTFLVDVTT